MKKALIILIVLVVLVAMGFGFLYFVWTPENMMSWGDAALAGEKFSKAISWYERAVKREPENSEFVLALADAHLADDNFTQAERALVNGIKAAPSADLYAKLSAVYVMQDKLMDAQELLDNITDSAIRAEIDGLRPQMPVLSHESGEYTELISLTMEADAPIYFSLTEDYPSTADTPYENPIDLAAGTTRVQAIAVGENGLVSPLFDGSYLLVGVVQEVKFVSTQLESMIREQLYLSDSEPIMTRDLWDITELTIPQEITDLTDLRYFENLTTLNISGNTAQDYSFLSALFSLENLDVSGSIISDEALKYIGLLPELKTLNLSHCGRSDISALSTAANLVYLDLSGNSIQDISALNDMSLLEYVNLESNAVTVLDPLVGKDALTELNISKNNLSSLNALANSTGLVRLIADDNQLMDVSVLTSMPQLEYFTAANNHIPDVSCLSGCTGMKHLDLSNNRLSSIDVLGQMPKLEYLDISHNSITELPKLPKDAQLQHFYASYNNLASVENLAGLPLLAFVDVDYNEELEDITCLSSCDTLVKVDAFGTKVKDIEALLDMDVIVNYDPSSLLDEDEDD